MSVVTPNLGAPWTWQEAQRVADKCPLSRPAKVESPRSHRQSFELPYYSHVCWCLVWECSRLGAGMNGDDLGKIVLIHEVSLSFISSNMSRKKQ